MKTQNTLFVYGSLMLEPVLETLLGRIPENIPGKATNWQRLAWPKKPYPILIQKKGHETGGKLLTNLTEKEIETLDHFEHPLYNKTQITITTNKNETLQTTAYTIKNHTAEQIGARTPWNINILLENLDTYLQNCKEFKNRYENQNTSRVMSIPQNNNTK